MRRSRKIKGGGDSTISVSTDAVSKLAADANQLAEDLGKLVPAEPAVQSDLSATPNVPAAVVQPSNVQRGDDASSVVKSPGPGDDAYNVQNDAAAAAAVQSPTAVVQNDAAGTPIVPEPGDKNAGSDQPSNAATSEPASLLTPETPIPYGNGSNSILYGKIATILNNMITNPANYNKKNIPEQQLQTLLTQIQSAKTVVEVSNILRANGIAPVGNGSKQYFSMNMLGGTKKRKRTKMTKRRKTRKMKITRKMRKMKMRKMRKTMKI
jgi:hypothetical protein